MLTDPPTDDPSKRKWPWYRPMVRNWRRYYLRQFPRKKTLHGGWLHRLLGNRLFDPGLWLPTRDKVAWGVAIGVFIGFMPFFGLQIVLSLVLCIMFRVNVTAAVVATFISNPLTGAGIWYLQYLIGTWLSDPVDPSELQNLTGAIRLWVQTGKPIMIGAVVTGVGGALVAFPLTLLIWTGLTRLGAKALAARHAKKHASVKSADTGSGPEASPEGPAGREGPKKD